MTRIKKRKKMKIQLKEHFTYKKLIRFSLPSIGMMVFTSVYGVVDGYFVSNFAGKTQFAGLNFIFPYIMILGALGFMIGTGGTALIGKTLGEGKREEANKIFSFLIYFSLIAGTVIGVIGFFTVKPVALLLGADADMAEICMIYGRICMLGMPAFMLQFEFQSLFVVAEKPQLGLYVTVGSGVMNMALDALLVGAFRLGVGGAASATVASQIVGGFVPVVYFLCKNKSLLHLGKTAFMGKTLLRVLGNGFSEFVSNISSSVVGMVYNFQLMKYAGEDGVAAYGVLMYVCFVFVSIYIGYSVGVAPVISYHYGAQNRDELKSLRKKSLVLIFIFAAVMLVAGESLAYPLSYLFTGYDEELMKLTARAFFIFSFSFLFSALPIFGSSFFTALNDGFTSAAISFLRTAVFQIGAVLLLPLAFKVDGIWYSLVFAEVTASAVAAVLLLVNRKKYGY